MCVKKKFEIEIIKVHEAHEGLVKLSERREQLERLARHKLQAEVKRLTDLNADLKDQVDVLSTQIANRAIPTDNTDALRKELNKRDVFIAQLVSQSKDIIMLCLYYACVILLNIFILMYLCVYESQYDNYVFACIRVCVHISMQVYGFPYLW